VSESSTRETSLLQNLWDERPAAALAGNPLELLRYRSNLLGEDLRITNFGGGNTSSKFELPDPLTGEFQRVMAVKGSGGDLRSMGTSGFAILYLGLGDIEESLAWLERGCDQQPDVALRDVRAPCDVVGGRREQEMRDEVADESEQVDGGRALHEPRAQSGENEPHRMDLGLTQAQLRRRAR